MRLYNRDDGGVKKGTNIKFCVQQTDEEGDKSLCKSGWKTIVENDSSVSKKERKDHIMKFQEKINDKNKKRRESKV